MNTNTRNILLAIFGSIFILVLLIGPDVIGFHGLFSFFTAKHEISLGRITMVNQATFMGSTTTQNQLIEAPHVKGEYPVGSTITLSQPIALSIYKTLTLTRVQCTTPGFKIVKVEPSLPVSAPQQGSVNIIIYIETPKERYTGPLDLVYYFNSIM